MNQMMNKSLRLTVTIVIAVAFIAVIFLFASLQGRYGHVETKNVRLNDTFKGNTLDFYSIEENTIKLRAGKDIWELQFIASDVLRVHILPKGKAEPNSPVLANREWPKIEVTVQENERHLTFYTTSLKAIVDKQAQTIRFQDGSERTLLDMITFEDFDYEVAFRHDVGEQFYGIHGFHANQNSFQGMLRDGAGVIEAGTQGNAGAPFIWTLQNFGLLFDTTSGNFSNFEGRLALTNRTKADLQYFVMAGGPLRLQQALAELTGKPPMFPKWSLGFNNSEWGIDQKELERDVDLYRQKQIPIDNYTLDFDWKAWGEDNYGESRWNNLKFPDGASGLLKQKMDAQGMKLTGIMKPRIHVNTVQGRYASEHNFWWPDLQPFDDYFSKQKVNVLNFALPEVRKWYFNDHVKDAFKTGIIGWWNDEADEMYDNLQFMNMQKTLYEGQRSISNQRVWSINRNFFLGSQRFAYGMWSGDIATGFYSMAKQRERLLSAVNIGQAKWGMDSGGFHGTPSAENYARWIQFSAFTPMFRVHGTLDEQRQPWVYGTQAEQIAKSAIQLRYQLVPYMYAYERRAYETGIGLIKPLLYDYPDDKQVENYIDAWMFGDHLLVAPVVEEEQLTKQIYLPAGRWIDYFSGKAYEGGKRIDYKLNAKTWEDIPLFIKEGAIIPKYPVMNYIGERKVDDVTIDMFPSENVGSFVFYDDDGQTYDYEKGAYFRQSIRIWKMNEKVMIDFAKRTGTYDSETDTYTLQVHGIEATNVVNATEWKVSKGIYGPVTIIKVAAGEQKMLTLY
jgi:alpha-glucosidase